MPHTEPPIISGFNALLHGGDYNPDQWQHRPDIIEEDYRLMKLAGCNTFSVGIFAWSSYEQSEGVYNFDWLDRTMDGLAKQGSKVFLATPSGGKPAWMSRKYPEIRRVNVDGLRVPQQNRHNHCPTSPVYREKMAAINERLAERYADHPALGGWHISNEYSGSCYCELCIAKFQAWLEDRYGSLDKMNRLWWTEFWSHRFTDIAEVDPRDESIDCLTLDWKRFTTWNTVDFMRHEVAAVREHSSLPVTTNFMGFFPGLDYYKLAEECDFIADDHYPMWFRTDKIELLQGSAMRHDQHRAMKQKPFLLIESTPSTANWQSCVYQKRPNQHRLQMLQSIAHGSDGAMYFQWRKGQGGAEKFHGAVVDHEGTENSRTFKGVAEVGEILKKIADVRGAHTIAEAAVIFDWEVHWALECSSGPVSHQAKQYGEACQLFHSPLWADSIAVDVIESSADLSRYKLLIASQLFMLKPGVGEALRQFVEAGGVLLVTTLSGIVNEHNLCFLGGQPGDGLRELLGVWVEETDEFTTDYSVNMAMSAGNALQVDGTFAMNTCIDLVHAEGAEVLATFADGIYAGEPALTVNHVGDGAAYYLAGRCSQDAVNAIVNALAKRAGLESGFPGVLPHGVVAQQRENEKGQFYFLLNATDQAQTVGLNAAFDDLIDECRAMGELSLPPFGSAVLRLASAE